jgi:hypothetical protein
MGENGGRRNEVNMKWRNEKQADLILGLKY